MAKQDTEKRRLQAAMQAAALDASKDAQAKDKRVQHLERKVSSALSPLSPDSLTFGFRCKHYEMNVLPRPGNSPKHSSTLGD